MANNTKAEVGLDFILSDDNEIFEKVIVSIVWGFLEIPVNAGLFGLVQFDRLGGDPLKRRVTDQVGTILWHLICQNDFACHCSMFIILAILKPVVTIDCQHHFGVNLCPSNSV